MPLVGTDRGLNQGQHRGDGQKGPKDILSVCQKVSSLTFSITHEYNLSKRENKCLK